MANNWIKCSIVAFAVCIAACQSRPSQNDGSVFVVYPEPNAKYNVDHTDFMKFMPRTTKRVPTTRKVSLNALARDEKDEKLVEKSVKSEPAEFRTAEEAKMPAEFGAVTMSNTFHVTEKSIPERAPIENDSQVSAVKSEPAEFRTAAEAKLPGEFDAVSMSNTFHMTEKSIPELASIENDSKVSAVLARDEMDENKDRKLVEKLLKSEPAEFRTAEEVNLHEEFEKSILDKILAVLFSDEKDEKLVEKSEQSRVAEEAKYPGEFDAVAMSNTFNVTEKSIPERAFIEYDSKISAVLLGILNETAANSQDKKEDYTSFIDQTISNMPQIVGMAAFVNDLAPMPEQTNDETPVTVMAPTPEEPTTLTNEDEVTTVTEGVESEPVTNASSM